MQGLAVLLLVTTLGADPAGETRVKFGWQPGKDGFLEYIIQLEPDLAKELSLQKSDLHADIPEELVGIVTKVVVRVGTEALPREGDVEGIKRQHKVDALPTGKPALGGGFNNQSPAPRQPDPRNTQPLPNSQNNPRVLTPPPFAQNSTAAPNRYNGTNPADRVAPLPREADSRLPARPAATERSVYGDQNNGAGGVRSPFPQDRVTGGDWRTQGDPRDPRDVANPNIDDRSFQPLDERDARPPLRNVPQINRQQPAPSEYAGQGYNPNYNPNYNPGLRPLNDPEQFYPDRRQPPPGYDWRPPQRPYDYPEMAARPTAPPPTSTPNTQPAPAAVATSTTTPAVTTPANIKSDARDRSSDDPPKQWLMLTFTAMLLFASVGLNFYLGWIANGIYARYRALLMEVRNVRTAVV